MIIILLTSVYFEANYAIDLFFSLLLIKAEFNCPIFSIIFKKITATAL